MPENQMSLFEVKAAAKREMAHIDGVQGFGVGDGSLRVYVQDACVQERLPADFHGARIGCVVVGTVRAL